LKSRTCKGNDTISAPVAIVAVAFAFAPGFSNQKPFTEMLMQPPQTENRQPRIEDEVLNDTDRLLAPRPWTAPALQAMPTAGARHFLLTFLLPSGQKVRRLSGRDPTVFLGKTKNRELGQQPAKVSAKVRGLIQGQNPGVSAPDADLLFCKATKE
jgi:hypothetical protein